MIINTHYDTHMFQLLDDVRTGMYAIVANPVDPDNGDYEDDDNDGYDYDYDYDYNG